MGGINKVREDYMETLVTFFIGYIGGIVSLVVYSAFSILRRPARGYKASAIPPVGFIQGGK